MRRKANKRPAKTPSTDTLVAEAAALVLPVLVGKAGAIPVEDEARRAECLRIVADAWDLGAAFVEQGVRRLADYPA